ncbi:hypothetical protein KP509_36G036100 [Ceratopteris richardii]|uniref:Uncharacterized protein n=1 Tax=Ceratopteris richardii TaxID=49495 RepID=A0A8T2QC83_CERRI|nr:hypothetical protein KP509_36G036100 [Ceratopteris richardii]
MNARRHRYKHASTDFLIGTPTYTAYSLVLFSSSPCRCSGHQDTHSLEPKSLSGPHVRTQLSRNDPIHGSANPGCKLPWAVSSCNISDLNP